MSDLASASSRHALALSGAEVDNTLTYLRLLKVPQLKEISKSFGLTIKGKKQDLLDRIEQYIKSFQAANENVILLAIRSVVLKVLNNDPVPDFHNLCLALRAGLIDVQLISSQNSRTQASISSTRSAGSSTLLHSPPASYSHRPLAQRYSNPYAGTGYSSGNTSHGSLYFPKYLGPMLLFPSTLFYTLHRMVHGFPYMVVASKGRNVCNIPVSLNQEEIDLLNMRDDTRIYLFSGLSSTPNPAKTDIQFPPIEIHVDGVNTKQYVKGLKGKPGTCRPADLTSYIKNLSRQFIINIVYSDAAEPYIIYLYIVNVRSPQKLVDYISTECPHISTQATKAAIKRDYEQDQDDDIIMATSSLSLRCPLTYARMKYPMKSTACDHVQCFDGLSFLTMQERIPSWICPVCSAQLDQNLLAVSDYMKEIIDNTPEDADTVNLNFDGSWEIKSEEDHSNDHQQEKQPSTGASVPTAASPVAPSTDENPSVSVDDAIEIVSIDSESEDEVPAPSAPSAASTATTATTAPPSNREVPIAQPQFHQPLPPPQPHHQHPLHLFSPHLHHPPQLPEQSQQHQIQQQMHHLRLIPPPLASLDRGRHYLTLETYGLHHPPQRLENPLPQPQVSGSKPQVSHSQPQVSRAPPQGHFELSVSPRMSDPQRQLPVPQLEKSGVPRAPDITHQLFSGIRLEIPSSLALASGPNSNIIEPESSSEDEPLANRRARPAEEISLPKRHRHNPVVTEDLDTSAAEQQLSPGSNGKGGDDANKPTEKGSTQNKPPSANASTQTTKGNPAPPKEGWPFLDSVLVIGEIQKQFSRSTSPVDKSKDNPAATSSAQAPKITGSNGRPTNSPGSKESQNPGQISVSKSSETQRPVGSNGRMWPHANSFSHSSRGDSLQKPEYQRLNLAGPGPGNVENTTQGTKNPDIPPLAAKPNSSERYRQLVMNSSKMINNYNRMVLEPSKVNTEKLKESEKLQEKLKEPLKGPENLKEPLKGSENLKEPVTEPDKPQQEETGPRPSDGSADPDETQSTSLMIVDDSRSRENTSAPQGMSYSPSAFNVLNETAAEKVKGILGIEISDTVWRPSSERSENSQQENSGNNGQCVLPIDNRIQNMTIETPVGKKRSILGASGNERSWNKRLSKQGAKEKFEPSEVNASQIIELDD